MALSEATEIVRKIKTRPFFLRAIHSMQRGVVSYNQLVYSFLQFSGGGKLEIRYKFLQSNVGKSEIQKL